MRDMPEGPETTIAYFCGLLEGTLYPMTVTE
jgi:hypothetical protein